MEQGAVFARVGIGPRDVKPLTVEQQAEIGYVRDLDTPFEEIVARQPGATWGERLRNAIQLTLEDYDYDKDEAMRDLRENGDKGIIRFAADGTPLGGKAIAGALRAAAKHPRMYRMLTKEEMQELRDEEFRRYRAGHMPRSKRRRLSPEERARRQAKEAELARARELLERTGGGTDLRRRPTAHKLRTATLREKQRARQETYARAVREAKKARLAAEKAARAAEKAARAAAAIQERIGGGSK